MAIEINPHDEFVRWCETRGLNQTELSELLNVSQDTLIRWLKGLGLPSVPNAARIEIISRGAVPMKSWTRGTDWEIL